MEEDVGLCECGGCLEAGEDLAGLTKWLDGLQVVALGEAAAAQAEERECLLGEHAEGLPAVGGVGVAVGGGVEVAAASARAALAAVRACSW